MSRTMKNCQMEVTYKGLYGWYNGMFEKLCWMILSKEHKINDKIEDYKNSLYRLKDCIIKKHKRMIYSDKKENLKIMLNDLDILIKHVEKEF